MPYGAWRSRIGAMRPMAHLAIVGSHSTNGVAALHSELIKQRLVPERCTGQESRSFLNAPLEGFFDSLAGRDRLRAGDIWVEGSRAFRAFDDFLLPPAAFAAKRKADELGLAVPDRFEAWRDERLEALEQRLREVATLASAGKLPEALITEAGLSINPIRQNDTDTDDIARRLYGMLPRLRITELLAEVNGWTGFAERFVHLRTGEVTRGSDRTNDCGVGRRH